MKKQKKSFLLVISLVLLLTVSVAGTLAYLAASTGAVVNTFPALTVQNEVEEDIETGIKKKVKIRNTGTADSYIRAAVVFTWVDSGATGMPSYHETPEEETDYAIDWKTGDDSGWIHGADGFYYYKYPVEQNGLTAVLFDNCRPVAGAAPEGYELSVEIMGQSIQAGGKDKSGRPPVEAAWSGTVTVKVDNDKTLTVTPTMPEN